MLPWLREKAARAAIGVSALLLILALASLWVGYRLTTYPIRRLTPASSAKRSAVLGVLQAVMILAAALRTISPAASPSDSSSTSGSPADTE